MAETAECWLCENEFEYEESDVYTMNDIREGQYIEFEAVTCPDPECNATISVFGD